MQLFSKKRKDIQFIFFLTSQLIIENLAPIEKDNVLAVIHESEQYSLLIMNMTKKKFSYVDLTKKSPTGAMLNNVTKFLAQHNIIKFYNTNFPVHGWSNEEMEYPDLQYGNMNDSGVYVIRFIQDLILHNFVSKKEFDVEQFRSSLSHYILHNSANMANLCVMCGKPDDANYENPIVEWMECEKCKRWCHNACLHTTVVNIAFTCILCSN